MVVQLVIYKSVAVDHLEHPLELNSCFIQDIRSLVTILRDSYSAVCPLSSGTVLLGELIVILESPYGYTTVNNVLTVVTSIVPTTCTVDGLALLNVRSVTSIGLNPLALYISCIRVVAVLAVRQSALITGGDVLRLYRNTGTVLIVVVHGVLQQLLIIDAVADLELMALVHYILLFGLRICPHQLVAAELGIINALRKQYLCAGYTNSILNKYSIGTCSLEIREINDMYVSTAVLQSCYAFTAHLNSSSLSCT